MALGGKNDPRSPGNLETLRGYTLEFTVVRGVIQGESLPDQKSDQELVSPRLCRGSLNCRSYSLSNLPYRDA